MIDSRPHMPKGKFTFDESVTQCFDDMLERSIPDYGNMRQMVTELASNRRIKNTEIVDLGSSRGGAISDIIDRFGAWNHYTLIEPSEPMRAALTDRFEGYINSSVVSVKGTDLRHEYPSVQASVTLSILTLQFIPIEYRHKILKNVYENTVDNGVLIIVEKVLGETSDINSILVSMYHTLKSHNGYSNDAIVRKTHALEGVLVPITESWNLQLLKDTGFKQVDCFWRYLNFSGFIAIK